MKKIALLCAAAAAASSTAAFAFGGFSDGADTSLPQDKAINSLAEKGIISGYEDGSFRPNEKITRAEMTVIMYRAGHGQGSPAAAPTGFDDVPEEHWASGYIAGAVKDGIINGIGENRFAPEAELTNEQAMKMLVCMKGLSGEAEKRGGYPNGYILTAVYSGIADDIEIVFAENAETSFQSAAATRGNIALMLCNALSK